MPNRPVQNEFSPDRVHSGIDFVTGHTGSKTRWEIRRGDAKQQLKKLPANSIDCVITSPPYYWQRDYKVPGQIGQEKTISGYVDSITSVMEECRRVMTKTSLLFFNLGDTYYSAKGEPKGKDKKNGARRFGLRAVDASGLGVSRKTSIGIPWRVALAMIDNGWTLRSTIIWQRPKSLPEPTAKDRPWRTYEHLFMFSRSPRYYFDRSELGGEEDIWSIRAAPKKSSGIHSAAFPDALVSKCLKTGCTPKGSVLDPFAGSGTVLRVALAEGHPATGIELSPIYCEYMIRQLKEL